ncbi:PASTA domain-containing protein [Streptomyces sp. NPDC018610]|uniref:PASTA domain-containing protein n=1 Tax=Streptomyces sp. NPDC018610 TaxID=3365049 RepID=UPI003798E9B6
MSETAVQRLLKNDHRTARAAAGESISLPEDFAKALLGELTSGEVVRALYHDGWGYAALTTRGLVLLRNLLAPKAVRVPAPLLILRRAYGMFGSVDVLVDGKPRKLHGSKLDPKGELLGTAGRLLPLDSPLRPGRGRRLSTWVCRHPVSVAAAAAVVAFAGLNPGSGEEKAVAQDRTYRTVDVPDFNKTSLASAVAKARLDGWRKVSAADASSASRSVKLTAPGWRVCFQSPSAEVPAWPSLTTLTLYAVPEREVCPAWLYGSRRIRMPGLVGERFDDASRALGDLGLDHVDVFHAHTGQRLDEGGSRGLADWQVCRQNPQPGSEVSTTTRSDLWLIDPGVSCTEPSPSPTPKPKPKPKPKPRPQSSYGTPAGGSREGGTGGGSSSRTGSGSGGSSGGSGGTGGSSGGSGTGGRAGVQFGQYCAPVGATATTGDGRPAKCFMGRDGQARWGYNSG